MNPRIKFILAILAAAAALWLAYRTIGALYFTPRAAFIKQIENHSNQLAIYRSNENDTPAIEDEIQQFVDRTLGGDRETVDHKLRTRLNRLAEQMQLQNHLVDTGADKQRESPAKSRYAGVANKALRDEIDFYELEGWVSGTGTFEQVVRLIDAIEAEPWIKRIDHIRLDPKDNGARVDVHISLTTLYLPRRVANPAQMMVSQNGSRFDRFQGLVTANPFHLPPPPVDPPPLAHVAAANSEQGRFPYEHWSLTGIAQGPAGAEVWLLNQQTRESKRLTLGQSLHEAILVAAMTDAAEFQIGDQRFLVALGKTVGDRTPANQ